ncbi:MAG TPA: hypothetical protein VGD98_13710 [Ktedonobacteraceae bacterium]
MVTTFIILLGIAAIFATVFIAVRAANLKCHSGSPYRGDIYSDNSDSGTEHHHNSFGGGHHGGGFSGGHHSDGGGFSGGGHH